MCFIQESVVRVIPGRFKGTSSKLQEGLKRTSRKFQGSYMVVSKVFQKFFKGVLLKFHENYKMCFK